MVMMDLSLALRLLFTQRTLALTVIATLALGIGSTVLMFSVVNGVLLQPLPFPGAGQLVSAGESSPGWKDNPVGAYTYRVWRERSSAFEHLAVMHRTERRIEGQGEPLIVDAAHVSANFFDAIGIQPALGRTFGAETSSSPIILSHQLWRRLGSDPGRQRLRQVLVSAEVAFSVVLLAGSVLLVRSFLKLSDVDLGFRPTQVLTAELRIPDLTYPVEGGVRDALLKRLLSRLQSLPGVTHVGASYYFPFSARQNTQYVIAEGRQDAPGQEPAVEYTGVIGDYLMAMAVPLIRGRLWSPEEMWERPGGVVVSASMAQMLWPGEDPIGKRLTHNRAATPGWMTVIGVVGDVRQRAVDQPPRPQWYFPYSNFSWPLMTLAVRTTNDPATLIPALRQAAREIDPNLPLHRTMLLEDVVAATMSGRRLAFGLLAGFAAMALLLAALGVYAAVANAVAQRKQEIGIRLALGATRGAIVGLVMRDGLLMVGVGCVAGVALGVLATRLMGSLLFGVSPVDAISFVAAVLILSAIACAACYIPARRAATVDPATSLRG